MRPRLAPIAMRSAISRARPVPRMQKEIGHVGAGDQQDKHDGAEEHQNGGTQIADEDLANRLERDAELVVGFGIGALQTRRDAFHFGARLFRRSCRRQPADHHHVAALVSVSGFGLPVAQTPIGSMTSVLSSERNSGGSTPMMVKTRASSAMVRPTAAASPPKCDCHSA